MTPRSGGHLNILLYQMLICIGLNMVLHRASEGFRKESCLVVIGMACGFGGLTQYRGLNSEGSLKGSVRVLWGLKG